MSADAAPDAGVAETAPSAAIDEIAPSPPSRSVTRSRKVVKLIDALRQADGDGAFVRRSIGRHELPLLDPFLLLDDFNAKAPAGFPPHPHRGQVTCTYLIEGRVEHEDFKGHKGTIGPGDLQWMTAGKGIVHAEAPTGKDACVGLQLWYALPKANKGAKAAYTTVAAKDVPVATAPGVTVKVIAGACTSLGVSTRFAAPYVPMVYLDVTLDAGCVFVQAIEPGWSACVYVLSGGVTCGGPVPAASVGGASSAEAGGSSSSSGSASVVPAVGGAGTAAAAAPAATTAGDSVASGSSAGKSTSKGASATAVAHQLAVFSAADDEDCIVVTASGAAGTGSGSASSGGGGKDTASVATGRGSSGRGGGGGATRFILLAGKPTGDPIVVEGTFAMNTRDQIARAIADFRENKNGFEGAKRFMDEYAAARAGGGGGAVGDHDDDEGDGRRGGRGKGKKR